MQQVDWAQVIVQLPIVAAFIWYSLELQKRYQESMDKRDAAYLSALEKIANKLNEHDQKLEEQIIKSKVKKARE